MITTEQSYAIVPELAARLKRNQSLSAAVGVVFLLLTIAGFFLSGPQQFLRSYLVGFFFWFGMGMGCLLLLMTQYLTGGAWGVVIRRPLEAGTKTIPIFFWGFLPLLIGVHILYWWTTPAGQADKMIQSKHLYLNLPFLWIRWVFYGFVWIGLTTLLNKWSRQEDATKSYNYSIKLEKLSGPGVVAFFFTMTFCAVDYIMTLEPHWYSTVYGFMIAMGQALSAMAFAIAILVLLAKYPPLDGVINKRHLRDLGTLMLALVMLWAYMNFAQLLITWSANLPNEVIWYVKRWNGGWGWVGLILLLGHFVLPFLLLLSQDLKKNPRTLSAVAIFVIVVRVVDVFMLVEPNFQSGDQVHFFMSWMDVTAPIGLGGLWLALFFYFIQQAPLLPLGAPDLKKALTHGRSH